MRFFVLQRDNGSISIKPEEVLSISLTATEGDHEGKYIWSLVLIEIKTYLDKRQGKYQRGF